MIEGVQNDWPLETPPFSTSPSNKDMLAETLKNPKKPNPVHHILAACPESRTAKAAKVLLQSGFFRREVKSSTSQVWKSSTGTKGTGAVNFLDLQHTLVYKLVYQE